jgi:hypothetical protein
MSELMIPEIMIDQLNVAATAVLAVGTYHGVRSHRPVKNVTVETIKRMLLAGCVRL